MKKQIKILPAIIFALLLSGCSLGKHVHDWSTFVKLDDESHYKVCSTDKSHNELEPHHFSYVGPYLDYEGKEIYRCDECGYEKIVNVSGTFTKEVVDKKFLYKTISSATAIYYKSDENGRYGDPLSLFIHTTLPSEYQEVEYVESKGGNYIDTGISIKTGDKLTIKYELAGGYLFGQVDTLSSENPYYVHVSMSKYSAANKCVVDEIVDGNVLTATLTNVDKIQRGTFVLFGNYENHFVQESAGKIYYFKYSRNNQLICDYVPCVRKIDGKAGFFDLVEKKFVTSRGKYYFAGGDVVSNELIDNEYYQTEYTVSNGYQYINTGAQFKANTKIETDFAFGPHPSYNFMFGRYGKYASIALHVDNLVTSCYGYGTCTNDLLGKTTDRFAKHHVSAVSGEGLTYDGSFFPCSNAYDDLNDDIYMFCASEETTDQPYMWNRFGAGKIYYFKIYEGDQLVRDFIPVVTKDLSTYGMYDKVEGKFYENQYQRQLFVPGEVVNEHTLPEGYTELSYIESTGDQYIDTGVIFDCSSDSFDIGCEPTLSNQATMIFASHPQGENGFYLYHDATTQNVSFTCCTPSGQRTFNTGVKTGDLSYHRYHFDPYELSVDEMPSPFGVRLSALKPTWTSTLLGVSNFFHDRNYQYYGKLYYARIYQDGILSRYFVPCINPENVVGLYDLVHGKFYTDNRSGYFGLGAGEAIDTKLKLGVEKEATYCEEGQDKYLDLISGEIILVPTDRLAYKVTFICDNSYAIIYDRGNRSEPVRGTVAYSYNVNSLNYSKYNSMVAFLPSAEPNYNIVDVELVSGICDMNLIDTDYYLTNIGSDIVIKIVTEKE